ncbi:MAG: hypothetical protein KDA51_09440, partial [Planctomycetales bacterium]|nr:hypothetical protein [Planctomycetales bacterium]
MILQWTLDNFKGFRDKSVFELAPLTLLAGTNSSGKTSVLQAMLLVQQTLLFAPEGRVLNLNGPLAKLGRFSDLANSSDPTRFGLQWKLRLPYAARYSPPGVLVKSAPADSSVHVDMSVQFRSDVPHTGQDAWASGSLGLHLQALDLRVRRPSEGSDDTLLDLSLRRAKQSAETRAKRLDIANLPTAAMESLNYKLVRYAGQLQTLEHELPDGFINHAGCFLDTFEPAFIADRASLQKSREETVRQALLRIAARRGRSGHRQQVSRSDILAVAELLGRRGKAQSGSHGDLLAKYRALLQRA